MFFSRILCTHRSLVGKVIHSPLSLTVQNLKEILWTAIELRHVLKRKNTKLDVVKGAKVLLLMTESTMYLEVPAIKASEMLSIKLKTIVDPNWDSVGIMTDTVKFFEINTDLVVLQCKFQCNLDTMTDIKIPLFTMQSQKFKMLQTLADLMTLQMQYKYLRKLKVAWIGPPNRLLNTYLIIGPKMGMNISYYCSINMDVMQSPALLDDAKKVCLDTNSTLEECNSLQHTIRDADILASSSLCTSDVISLETLNLAGKNCCLIFDLPRRLNKIEKSLIDNEKRCLTWDSVHNMKWILAAVMIRLLSGYKPVIDMPKF